MILDEWRFITKTLDVDIIVIDMPLLDTRIEGKNLVGKFISDLVLQILSFVAQNERENIRLRQKEGIRIAKEKGIHMGRPSLYISSTFSSVIEKYLVHEINNHEARKELKISRGTFFKYLRIYKEENKIL